MDLDRDRKNPISSKNLDGLGWELTNQNTDTLAASFIYVNSKQTHMHFKMAGKVAMSESSQQKGKRAILWTNDCIEDLNELMEENPILWNVVDTLYQADLLLDPNLLLSITVQSNARHRAMFSSSLITIFTQL